MSLDCIDGKSTLALVVAWCHETGDAYITQLSMTVTPYSKHMLYHKSINNDSQLPQNERKFGSHNTNEMKINFEAWPIFDSLSILLTI